MNKFIKLTKEEQEIERRENENIFESESVFDKDINSSYKVIIKNAFFYNHPVLVQGLALAPVLIASTNIKNALSLAFCLLFVSFPSVLFSSIGVVKRHFPKWIRVFCYVLIASIFYIPAYFIIEHFYPEIYFSLGVFMPLIIVSSFVYNRCEKFAHKSTFFKSIVDIIANNLSLTILIIIISGIREFLSSGKLLGLEIIHFSPVPAIAFSFSGFIIGGLIAAFLQFLKNKNIRNKRKLKKGELNNV